MRSFRFEMVLFFLLVLLVNFKSFVQLLIVMFHQNRNGSGKNISYLDREARFSLQLECIFVFDFFYCCSCNSGFVECISVSKNYRIKITLNVY